VRCIKTVIWLCFLWFGMADAFAISKGESFQFSADHQMHLIKEQVYIAKPTPDGGFPPDKSFIPFKEVKTEDMISGEYWMRVSITNTEDHTADIQFFPGLCEELMLYIPNGESYEKYSIGAFEKSSVKRKISGYGKGFMAQALLTIAANSTETYYLNFKRMSGGIQAQRDAQLLPRIISGEVWRSKIEFSEIIWSFIFGCFVMLLLYHIVYLFLTKDLVYLYFSLFVFAVSFPFLTLVTDLFDAPKYNALLFFSVSGMFSAFYFQLTRKLLGLKELLPKWDKILRVFIVAKALLVALYSIFYIVSGDIFVILSVYIPSILVELSVMVLLAVALLKTKDRISLFFVIGSSLAWLAMLIAVMSADDLNSLTPQLSPIKYATPAIGFVLESLVFAMVLSYRARMNEIDKKKAQNALIDQLQENKKIQEIANKELELKVKERTKDIKVEQQKAENLLLNVLPKSVVQEMKEHGKSVPKKFDNVTVLFADFVGFTAISSSISPEDLVEQLNFFFAEFDAIMKRHGLEKIKTIGDAYLAVSGLPVSSVNHAEKAVQAAKDLMDFLDKLRKQNPVYLPWQMRIGVHSGDVVAGVIGDYKFAYDIWGDTVNVASRLETNSRSGKINISGTTYELVKDKFECQARGEINVKNRGKVPMYFVS
jgi:adenylate cyclase